MPKEIDRPIRDKPPCHGCNEKFTACHDHCPKDARGEFGYKAWKQKIERVKRKRKEYMDKPFSKIL